MKVAPPRSRLTTLKNWAVEIGLPYTSARGLVVRGELPSIRIGRAIYVERADGDRWILSRKETAA